jgi:hypothetical protein
MNEDTLILYYYDDELTEAERRDIASAISADPEVARRYQDVCRQLDELADAEALPAPAHVVERWHDAIDRAAQREAARAPPRSFHFGSFFWGTAVAASLAVGIAIGVYMSGGEISVVDPDNSIADLNAPGPGASKALSRGLLVHFQESRNQLAGLSPDANGDRSALIMNIINQNRMYERAAANSDSQDLARLLRAFEPVLLRLAADDISPADTLALQSQLAFELNIVLTKLSRNLSNDADSIDI